VEGTVFHRLEVDRLIQKYLIHWELQRLCAVDRNLMRLALFEILHRPDIPNAVAINESLELAKKYGSSEEAVAFINGVLDRAAAECTDHEK
ncbi:MAG: transcription antitermination factor NusB, partial [Firmicutes bacterium]|nr:transcription antitermination factor NusB [Bacillota bacterium]